MDKSTSQSKLLFFLFIIYCLLMDVVDHSVKILLIGDSGVGKSSLLLRYTSDQFDQTMNSTIGVDFRTKIINVDGKRVKLSLWDTAGQERFRTLTSSYYRGAHGVIFVYDVTNPESFQHLEQWSEEVNAYCTYSDVVKLLVANKVDLMDADSDCDHVAEDRAKRFAREHKMVHICCSAKTKVGVQHAFEEVARKIVNCETLVGQGVKGPQGVNINRGAQPQSHGACC